jgi:short-subunit dehydrogenase
MEKNYMVDVNLEYYKNMIDINILPQTLLTKIFTESLSKRTFRSAIIDLASVSSLKPLPYRALYAASKSYNDFLSRALSVEYENYNIDFLSVNPFLVESPLSKEKYNGITILTSNQTVQGSLNDLGHENYTHGHWLHKIQAYIWDKIPFIIIALIFRRK